MASNRVSGRGFTLIELLVVIAIISVIAGLVIPGIILVRERANIAHCAHNLQQIYAFAQAYSEKDGSGSFPIAKGSAPRAHESLNELIAFEPEALTPDLFVCRSSGAVEATRDEDGRGFLDDGTSSYAWTARRLKTTAYHKPLASDKYVDGYEDGEGVHSGHKGMNVLWTDGSVKFVKTSELPSEALLLDGLTR